MDAIKLTDQEQRVYGELFNACDVENSAKIPGVKASELFLTSGLPHETLFQVAELCGAKRLGHFGRSQFYIALKLIAVAQCGLPVSLETFGSGIDIPLPKFNCQSEEWMRNTYSVLNQPEHDRNVINLQQHQTIGPTQSGGLPPPPVGSTQSGGLPPPPVRQHSRSYSAHRGVPNIPDNSQQQQQTSVQTNSRGASPHASKSPPFSSPKDSPVVSPGSHRRHGYMKQQSMPAQIHSNNSSATYNNSSYHDAASGQQKLEKGWTSFEDEDSQGLISQDRKDWAQFEVGVGGAGDHNKADTSSITSSEAESIDDVWTITDEQREYYLNQFKSMQSDLTGVIIGARAKEFFEKSKLPVVELSKIWQLSDVNKDGALSLDEFCTAMHLVVLRRNEVEIPDKLPASLMPYTPLVNDEPFAADLPPGSTLKRHTPTEVQNQPNQWATNFPPESPSSSAVSSPGTKPVNFEFKPVTLSDPDCKIAHPVAVRMSPDGVPIPPNELFERSRTFSDPTVSDYYPQQENVLSPTRQRSSTVDGEDPHAKYLTPLQGRPRPTPKKAQSVGGSSFGHLAPPPAVPPRASPRDAPGGNQKSSDITGDTVSTVLTTEMNVTSPSKDENQEEIEKQARQISKDKQDLQAAIRRQRERNTVLSRLNGELNQELQEVMEQRIGIEIQLEHLRPFSS
ncbi:ralBP1-associated Eps domain-containing protein 1-like isoform X2 [Tubulanus polymorphus]|uniref:ralBP1-associated Eps domain-containing protein 1-like isoform X2 n=1 Tax=Tubulanus polymorphus TaxID=672921 RepID=UPI003DA43D38